jgi:hypothetical protein
MMIRLIVISDATESMRDVMRSAPELHHDTGARMQSTPASKFDYTHGFGTDGELDILASQIGDAVHRVRHTS